MSNPSPVTLQGIGNRFGDHIVHDCIDLEINDNEIFSLVGGSGSGKTVLLNTMIGLHQPTSGEVRLLGHSLHNTGAEQQSELRNRIGVLFQAGALFSAFSVGENIQFPIAELHSVPKNLMRELVQLKLNMVGLEARDARKLPAELSGGMRKRAALARALALDPEILFLDEPTSGLDPVSAEQFVDLISELRTALELTIVMVTHDLYTLTQLSDRVGVLADRGIVALGKPADVMAHPHPFVQAYFRLINERDRERDGRAPPSEQDTIG